MGFPAEHLFIEIDALQTKIHLLARTVPVPFAIGQVASSPEPEAVGYFVSEILQFDFTFDLDQFPLLTFAKMFSVRVRSPGDIQQSIVTGSLKSLLFILLFILNESILTS